jgi:hypothetical protein
MDEIIDDVKFIDWGKRVYEIAKLIRKYRIYHTNKYKGLLKKVEVNNGLEELYFNLFDENKKHLSDIEIQIQQLHHGFDRFRIDGDVKIGDLNSFVNLYWIDYILNFIDEEKSEAEEIVDIVERMSGFTYIFQVFFQDDFFINDKGELIHNLIRNQLAAEQGINILVPYTIGKLELELLILFIKATTNTYIHKIYLFNASGEVLFVDNSVVKQFREHPYIKGSEFLDKKFFDINNWCLEVPQFKKYIDEQNKLDELPF